MEPPCWYTLKGHQYGGRKIVLKDMNLPSLVPDGDKNFGGSLVLDFRK